jgi:excisionase family DNA binding protein
MTEMTIREAADALGVSMDTIRRRVRRGEFASRRDARGWVLVELPDTLGSTSAMHAPAAIGSVPTAGEGMPLPEVLARLEEENRWLRGQLDEAARERAELRQLLAGAMRTPELPAPVQTPTPDTAVAAQRAQSDAAGTDRVVAIVGRSRQPWWQFWR